MQVGVYMDSTGKEDNVIDCRLIRGWVVDWLKEATQYLILRNNVCVTSCSLWLAHHYWIAAAWKSSCIGRYLATLPFLLL